MVISSVSPRNFPVEKPSHECSAYGEGDGRPSSQMTRSPGVFSYEIRYADELTGQRIGDLVDPHRVEPLRLISRGPRPALQKRGRRIHLFVVGVRPHAGGIVQREAAVVARKRTGIAIALVFVIDPAPRAGQVNG